MGKCQSKKAAVRQKEMEEEQERMRKLEEQAKAEIEQREKEAARKEEIERLMNEEREAKQLAEMMKNEEEAKMKQEADAATETENKETVTRQTSNVEPLSISISSIRLSSGSSHGLRTSSNRSRDGGSTAASDDGGEAHVPAGAIDMKTFTPWDMSKIDSSAKYMATKCGCSLSDDHNSAECQICQGIDLSDAPLIA
ncbi:hypothetical protein BdWA1_003274 [Babesia duncani]|uniref:Gliding-associated protein 45 n=1 Tax=Babesia duncani TaxID=323732 RepID=A0AAD9UNB8_9APIC|nr:hypothetical protein BdWA1_003274 [Babesia duncani]